MSETRDGQRRRGNSLMWPMPAVAGNALFAVVTDINGKLLEGVANAQKDWAEFVHRRVKEDIAASQQLVNCQSLADMREIYSQYFHTAFEQYREQSERIIQRGKSMTDAVVQSTESRARETRQTAGH